MKIGTNRNLEDPIGFWYITSTGFCSTASRIYVVLFNFCPSKAVFFQSSSFYTPAIGVRCFADSQGAKIFTSFWQLRRNRLAPWTPCGWVGRVPMMPPKNLEIPKKCCFFKSSLKFLYNLSDKVVPTNAQKKLMYWSCFGRCTKFPDHHTAGALLHRAVHANFALAPKIVPSS